MFFNMDEKEDSRSPVVRNSDDIFVTSKSGKFNLERETRLSNSERKCDSTYVVPALTLEHSWAFQEVGETR